MFKAKLNFDVLEAREVPAFLGLTKGGPQPEPPTSPIAKAGILFPVFKPAQVSLPTTAVNGILLPALSEWAPPPPFASRMPVN